MGRLDDAAKRKVVELRKAGLSFRKIKAVLELENIKVSAQAIYLFLKEFQGKARPEDVTAGSSGATQTAPGTAAVRVVGSSDGRHSGWSDQQLRSLLREAGRYPAPAPTDTAQQSGEARGHPSGAGGSSGGSREGQQVGGKDDDIRIVSVTSLAQGSQSQHGTLHAVRQGVGAEVMAGTFVRRRVTPSPASNPVLVARKRLLDKALLHRARIREGGPQSGQQVASLLRRDQSGFSGSDVRKVMLPQTASYDLTTPRPPEVRGLHPGAGLPRRTFQQRPGVPVRPLHQPPRVGIRLPSPSPAGAAPQGAGPAIRIQAPASQPPPTSQQGGPEVGARAGLQEQVQGLGSEVRGLGLVLRMLVETQGRLEREQAQQTQVQKQILSTLQGLASRLGPCGLRHTHAPTPPAPSSMPSVAYGQDAFTSSQGAYAQCSQPQPRYSELDGSGLESMEAFTLAGLSSTGVNGFQPCSSANSLSLSHAQTHAPAHAQSHAQTYSPAFTQSHTLSYTQAHTESYTGMDRKTAEYPSTSNDGPLQDCSPSTHSSSHPVSPLSISPHEPQFNIIKVETV